MSEKEKIRKTIRDRYGEIARSNNESCGIDPAGSCRGSSNISGNEKSSASCCGDGSVAFDQLSEHLGYTKEDIKTVPEGSNMGLGCGNPVAMATLKPGETVVDLGSGGGFDCFLAADKVGGTGRVIGVDMTPDMISKARTNSEKIKAKNIEFRLGEIEHLPIGDNRADIIMSNCVINLSPDKHNVYKDAFRVLKPGGRLAISDILASKPLPEDIRTNLELLSACIGGASTIDETKEMLKRTGFKEIKISPKTISQEIIDQWAPGHKATNLIVSAYIEAVKPL